MKISNYTNPQYNVDGTIDLDILTDVNGLIPITINLTDNDQEPHILACKQWLTNNANLIAAYVAPVVTPQYKTQFTSLQVLARFTQAEQEAVALATLTNMPLKLFYDKLLAATFVDISDPVTIGGVDALIAFGLLDAARRDAILLQELVV